MQRTIQAVQFSTSEFRNVANVMQPRCRLEQLRVGAEGGPELTGSGGYALDVRPPARESVPQEVARQVFGPGGRSLHGIQPRNAWRDVHRRGLASGDV